MKDVNIPHTLNRDHIHSDANCALFSILILIRLICVCLSDQCCKMWSRAFHTHVVCGWKMSSMHVMIKALIYQDAAMPGSSTFEPVVLLVNIHFSWRTYYMVSCTFSHFLPVCGMYKHVMRLDGYYKTRYCKLNIWQPYDVQDLISAYVCLIKLSSDHQTITRP